MGGGGDRPAHRAPGGGPRTPPRHAPRAGEAQLVIGDLEALVNEDPLREERWRLLTLALYRAHRQAAALAALRRARQVLADELGVDPGPALRSLEAEVLAQSPDLDVPTAARTDDATRTSSRGHGRLTGSWTGSARWRSCAPMVDELGEGRSGLPADRGPRRHRQDPPARRGPHARRRCRRDRPGRRGAARWSRASTSRWSGSSSAPTSTTSYAASERFAVLRGLREVTADLAATAPLVLCVDDIQWCDEASLQFLAYLVRRLEGLPVLVVLAVRSGETHEADDLLAELAGNESVSVLHPAPLTEQGTAALVADRLGRGADTFVATCHRMTSGNPLLLRQLLRALADQGVPPDAAHVDTVRAVGSRAITSLVTLRLRRMPATVTTVAHAVAVLGPLADLVTVADAGAALGGGRRGRPRRARPQRDPPRRSAARLRQPAGARRDPRRHPGGRARAPARADEPSAQVILKSARARWGAPIVRW